MSNNKLLNNTISSLVLQVVTIICGFILPHLILGNFGSEINGLVNSITQFLSIISFLDLGVGAVFQSSLYEPLANGDNERLSKIYVSGQKFFKRLAVILLVYIVVLVLVYPIISNQGFGFIYTATLIIAMSISSFAQYYFGMANGLLLTADQRGYVSYNVQIVTLIINTITSCLFVSLGASIHVIKLATSCIYFVRPVFLKLYVDHNYDIDYTIRYDEEPIQQKWNGFAQHVASVVLESTDTIVLTIFSTLSNVSIYSVYYLVISGIKQLFTATTNGIQAFIGELIAKDDLKELQEVFSWTEWTIHNLTTFVFGCSIILIVPFVLIYTQGVSDANYDQPVFAFFIVMAYAMYCYRLPYHILIKAAVHYQQTQHSYIIATAMNVIISIIAVKWYGLVGVAIGTLTAMLYQTLWMAWYDSRNIIRWPFIKFLKQMIIDIMILITGCTISRCFRLDISTYMEWCIAALRTMILWVIIAGCINIIFYRDKVFILIQHLFHRKK